MPEPGRPAIRPPARARTPGRRWLAGLHAVLAAGCTTFCAGDPTPAAREPERTAAAGSQAPGPRPEGSRDPADPSGSRTGYAAVAVVELFTSEGCSSCPAADRNLMRLVESSERAEPARRSTHALEFHVDYWDSLGWRDPFGQAAFSERQRRYARRLSDGGRPYTPQMVVNGEIELVGSRSGELSRALAKALATPARARVSIRARAVEGPGRPPALQVDYRIETDISGPILNLATALRRTESRVRAGENRGELLRHANVVRQFSSFVAERLQGRVQISMPPDLKPQQTLVVAYVQTRDLRVVGATAAELTAPDGAELTAPAAPN